MGLGLGQRGVDGLSVASSSVGVAIAEETLLPVLWVLLLSSVALSPELHGSASWFSVQWSTRGLED